MMNDPFKRQKHKSQKRGKIASLSVTYVILVILAFIWIIPIFWVACSAFRTEYKDGTFVGAVTSGFVPSTIGFKNL